MSLDINDFVKVGTLAKAHGNRGGIVMFVEDNFPEDLDELEYLFLKIDGGLVPFYLTQITFRNQNSAIVEFDKIDNPNLLDQLYGKEVYLEMSLMDNAEETGEIASFTFVGFELYNAQKQLIGIIEEIIPYPNNPVYRLKVGREEVLIPANADLVSDIDQEGKKIFMNLPDGLVDLFLED